MNKKALLIGGCALAVVAIVVALIFIFTGGEDAYRSIKVFEIDGSCRVDRGGDSLDAFKNMALSSGDSLTVGEGSFARLKLDDDKYVYLEANTKINLTATGTANDSKTMVYIERGSMLTEVKKKLSATSSYDIVTPNTTMSIRGTKTLTQVLEDAVTGHVQTSNAVLEGQVKIKAVKVKADGTVVSVEKDLGAGEGNAFSSNKEELVSQEEMKSIADTGASVNGIKVEIVSEEDADVVFDVATFQASFLENVKNILVADAQAETGEEGLSQEQIDAINAQLDEVLESFDVISTESQNAINAAASGEIEPEPTPEITPEPTPEATSESVWSWENIAVTEDTQDEGTTLIEGDTNLLVIDDTDEADDTADRDNGADEVGTEDDDNDDAADEDGEEADETDEDEVSDEDDNAGEDDVDDADDAGDEDKSDEEGEEENTDEEDADKEDGEDEEAEDDEEQSEEKSESDSDAQNSESTDTPNTSTTDPNTSGTSTGTQTNEPTPVTYSYSRSFSTSSQGSASEQDTVSLVFKQGNEVVSADMLPSSYAANAPLPGSNGSGYSVSIDSDHAAKYQFTGWYVTEQLAQEADPAKSVANMPSSSSSNVPLYAGIRKIPVKITITNMYPHAGRFYAPERDSAGHEYALTGESEQYPNLLTITGYEYGDEFALPEECRTALSLNNGDLSEIPYVGGFTATDDFGYNQTTDTPYYPLNQYSEGATLFYGYSTVGTVNLMEIGAFLNTPGSLSYLQAYHPVENEVEGEMYYNYNPYDYVDVFREEGQGVNTRISLTADALEYNDQDNSYVLKLYAYFGTYVDIYLDDIDYDKLLLATSDGDKKLSELPGDQNISVIENSASGERTRIWKVEDFGLSTMKQDSYSVAIPEFKTDTSVNLDKYTVRLADRGLSRGLQRWSEGKSYVNNGSLKVDESFFENGPATAVEFEARLTKYVVLDLDIDLTVNHFGEENPYYIKELGDSGENGDQKYKIAVTEFCWENGVAVPFGLEPRIGRFNSAYSLAGTPTVSTAFGSSGDKHRYYVMVPDDAYYPWGMKGQGRDSEDKINTITETNLSNYIGQEYYQKNAYVGDPFGKLYGYRISYSKESVDKQVNALYSEAPRGVPSDYTIMLKDSATQTKSVGVLMSLGFEGELFDSSKSGQVVLRPLMGPHKQPFWFSLIYDYDGYNTGLYTWKNLTHNVSEGYKFRITLPCTDNLDVIGTLNAPKCEIVDVHLPGANIYEVKEIGISGIKWVWKTIGDNRVYVACYSYLDPYENPVEAEIMPIVDETTGFLHYDFPLHHLVTDWPAASTNLEYDPQVFVRGLVWEEEGNGRQKRVDYTNIFMKQNQETAGTPYTGDNFSLIPETGNYIPCAFDVCVDESDVCKFTGLLGVFGDTQNGDPLYSLRRVVQESDHDNCLFEMYKVVEDLQFMSGSTLDDGPFFGAYVYGTYSHQEGQIETVVNYYGYYDSEIGTNGIVPCDYNTLLTYNSTGYIDVVLHGTDDTNRYGGLLLCKAGTRYVKFANSDLSSITLYTYSNGSLEVVTDVPNGFWDLEKYEISGLSGFGQIIRLNEKLYMCIENTVSHDSYLVEITDNGANGSAKIGSFDPE